jgi:hypothetical protein
MSALLRALPTVTIAALLAGPGLASGMRAEEPLPPIFAPIAERPRTPAKLALAPPVRPTLISPHTRALLEAGRGQLPLPAAGDLAPRRTPAGEIITMEKYIVNLPRLRQATPERDTPPVWRAVRDGILWRNVRGGRDEMLTFGLAPVTSIGPISHETVRFELAYRIRF